MSIPFDQPIRLVFDTFSDAAQTIPADPTTVSLDVRDPTGVVATYTWAGAGVVKDSTGVFHHDVTTTVAGHYQYHWKAAGAVATSKDGFFDVDPEYGFATNTLDLLTIAEAKLAIGNNAGTTNDGLLASAITGVSQFLDELCGPIVVRTITSDKRDGGRHDVILDAYPIVSVTTLTEYRHTTAVVLTEETPGVLPADGFIIEPLEGRLIRRKSGRDYHFAHGRKNVVTTYVAGRYADTGHVAERFKRAAGITLANYWRREHGGGQGAIGIVGITFGLPDAARKWIEKDIQGVMA